MTNTTDNLKNDIETAPNKEKVAEALTSSEALTAFVESVKVFEAEYGDYKLTKRKRKQLAKDFGVEEEKVNGWQKVSDILDHIDLVELAKKHPDSVRKIVKGVASIVGFFVGPVKAIVDGIDATSDSSADSNSLVFLHF